MAEPNSNIVRILSVMPHEQDIYFLVTDYPESDPLAATGRIHRATIARGGGRRLVLSVGDSLGALWTSPEGSVWTGSVSGNLWTTARLMFPAPLSRPVSTITPEEDHQWAATTLPKLRAKGYPPNITCLYGFSDENVFAGTFSGSIYHWDGEAFTEMEFPGESGIIEMHGTSRNSLFAACDNRMILHFNGKRWTPVPMPREVPDFSVISGIRAINPHRVYACDIHGRIYRGTKDGFEVISATKEKWYGIALLENRVLLASTSGAWELTNDVPVSIRSNFSALDVCEASPALFFIEEEQQPRPCWYEYNPTLKPEWGRRKF